MQIVLCIFILDWEEKDYSLVFLRYIVKGDISNIKPLPHGNSKDKGAAYYQTKHSTMGMLTEAATSLKPRKAYKVFEEMGGVAECNSIGSMPRNCKQITNIRHKKSDPPPKDSLYEIMKNCVEDQSRSDPFVRRIQAAPEATCVLATNRQLNDIEKFCTNKAQCSVLGIDPTFNLGDFSVTVTIYQHLMLESKRSGKSLAMIGPMFAHQKKEAGTYHAFASSLVGLKYSLSNVQCIGTDGEIAIYNGFKLAFPNCKHIQCFLHTRRNIVYKLTEIGLPAAEFIREIFGFQNGTHFTSGIVDSRSEIEFEEKLKKLKDIWCNREKAKLKTETAQFYNWFVKYHAKSMKSNMLLPLRDSLRIGRATYTTSANESINAVIKKKLITRLMS